MKKAKNIHNLDTLDKEIYRLKLEAKNIEDKLDDNFEKLRHNWFSMSMNSIFHKKKNEESSKSHFFDSFFKNDGFNAVVNKITDHIANRASDGIDSLIDKIFHKKKE
jgi:hypothetical protein